MTFISWRGLLLVGCVALGLVQLTPWARTGSPPKPAASTSCEAWDREASQGIATLIHDNSLAAELRLDEAMLQLRRARRNCRAGSITAAEHDYASLRRTFPVATGSLQATAPDASKATPLSSGR